MKQEKSLPNFIMVMPKLYLKLSKNQKMEKGLKH